MNPKDAKIGIMTHAFHYGTATFGGLNATWDEEKEQYCIFRLLDHYRRQLYACKLLHIKLPYNEHDMAQSPSRRSGARVSVRTSTSDP